MADKETLWTVPGHALAGWGNVFIQLRATAMTAEALAALETNQRLWLARWRAQYERVGGLFIALDGAPPVTGELADAQRQIFEGYLKDHRFHMSIVIEGQGIGSVLLRTLVRTRLRIPQRAVHSTVLEGARWLVEQVKPSFAAPELAAFAGSLRPAPAD
jgi:hypothetical protein